MPPKFDTRPGGAPETSPGTASGWRRAYRRFHRFLFEKEPGFLPTPHVNPPDGPRDPARRAPAAPDGPSTPAHPLDGETPPSRD